MQAPLAKATVDAPLPPTASIAADSEGAVRPTTQSRPRQRLIALDTFRGITVAAMILVNSPGADRHGYRLLRHAKWNGWEPADLIFPAFLFIAGVAIPLSLGSQVDAGVERRRIGRKILIRTRIIFGLGLLLNALPYFDWDLLRIPGVLQRIAVCYGVAALAALSLDVAGLALLAVFFLGLYWALVAWVPVPGVGAAVLEPGLDLGSYVDRLIMGRHLAQHDWDPEGLLSTIPAIASTLAGVLTGHWLRLPQSKRRCLMGMIVAGLFTLALGKLMTVWLPINKNLWTSSFAVFTTGTSLLGFAACFWLTDLVGARRWTLPFVIYGTNPLLAYGLSSLGTKLLHLVHMGNGASLHMYIYNRVFAHVASPSTAGLLYAITYTLLWFIAMAALYRRGIVVKI